MGNVTNDLCNVMQVAAKSHLNTLREKQVKALVNGLERERQSQLDTDPLSQFPQAAGRREAGGTVWTGWTAGDDTSPEESPGLSGTLPSL